MGMVRNIQIAWGVYKTVKGFLGKGEATKTDTLDQIGKLLGAGSKAGTKAVPEAAAHATDLVRPASIAGAVALPLLKRVKRTAIKGGIAVGVVAAAAKVGPWYLKRKLGIGA